ncbi:MAG: hypothetical protein JRF49_07825 [Deltaproteobacteria bacterium]|nr:hypothetical protein [Deltaproteobacteria bacterium]
MSQTTTRATGSFVSSGRVKQIRHEGADSFPLRPREKHGGVQSNKQALQQGFTSRSRWLLQILGLRIFLKLRIIITNPGIPQNVIEHHFWIHNAGDRV